MTPLQHELFSSISGGQFEPVCTGQFGPVSGGQFKSVGGGQLHRFLHLSYCRPKKFYRLKKNRLKQLCFFCVKQK